VNPGGEERNHGWVRVLLAVMLASVPAGAAAQVSSEWTLAEGCPDAEHARARADELLAEAAEATLTVEISAGYRAHMRLEGAVEAERSLEDSDCVALVEATVVLAALSLGLPPPEVAVVTEPTVADPVDVSPSAPATAPAPVRAPTPAPSSEGHEPRARVGLYGLVDTTVPAPRLGVGLTGGLALGALRLDAGIEWLPGMRFDRDAGEGATFYALRGTLQVGASAAVASGPAGRLELGGYGRGELGVLHGRGFGVAQPESGGGVLWTLGAGGALGLVGDSLGADLSAGVVLPVMRPTFVLDGAPLFTPDSVGLRVSLGLWLEVG